TWTLGAAAGTVLNLSEDRFDRYVGLADYGAAKARIFQGHGIQVLNRDDPASLAMALPRRRVVSFGLDAPPAAHDFGVAGGALMEGPHRLLQANALPIHGAHNVANALAACALARAAGVARRALAPALAAF